MKTSDLDLATESKSTMLVMVVDTEDITMSPNGTNKRMYLDTLVSGGTGGVYIVPHGTDPDVARPDAPIVIWLGIVQPNNAIVGDVWIDNS